MIAPQSAAHAQELLGQEGDKKSFKSIYPNPARDQVFFHFDIDLRSHIEIDIYNQIGKKIQSLKGLNLERGQHQIPYDSSKLNKGIYFVYVTIGQERYIRKFSVLGS
jgi:hypothetical protein